MDKKAVIESIDAKTIYDVPLLMLKQNLDKIVLKKLKLSTKTKPDLVSWKNFLGKLKNPVHEIKIGLVGKYNEYPDAYKSIYESFIHAGAENECKVIVVPIHAEKLELDSVAMQMNNFDGVLVAPGFGDRGIEGKINAIKYIRENNIPFFGICLGMQCAVIEYARNVMGLKDANSTEFDSNATHPIVGLMEEQKKNTNMGGTMRLGAYECTLSKPSLTQKAYGKTTIHERHRHRYEFNNKYLEKMEKSGMKAVGINKASNLVEVVELTDHPYFIGVQYHPELKSTVENPHPLFVSFVKNALKHHQEKNIG